MPEPHPFAAVLQLPRDDEADSFCVPDAHGALHWAPHRDRGFSSRMDAIARWVSDAEPQAFVVDVSVEVATFVRLLGVPVIVVALPGKRLDEPHLLVHRLADHIVAAWPREQNVPAWLTRHDSKTSYVGGISRFDGRERPGSPDALSLNSAKVLVLGGAGGMEVPVLNSGWTVLGTAGSGWTSDPWPQICAADVVVTHAGQNSIADVAAAQRPAVVIPQVRPFDEQRTTARVLHRAGLAVVAPHWPDPQQWPALLRRAVAGDPRRWQLWRVPGAAARAADAIETTARCCWTQAAR
ncbi:MAG: glycosyltransferase [Mycobacterium sp.]